jgi:hypothetical protein
MANLDGYTAYQIDLTSEEIEAAVLRAHNIDSDLNTKRDVASSYSSTQINSLLETKLSISSTFGAALLPSGTSAQRPASPNLGSYGYIRYNTDINAYETYTEDGWYNIATHRRVDKWLKEKDIVNIFYVPQGQNGEGKPQKIRYGVDNDTNFEVMTYNENHDLTNIAHYRNGGLEANTTWTYENDLPKTITFTEV